MFGVYFRIVFYKMTIPTVGLYYCYSVTMTYSEKILSRGKVY